MNSSRGCAVTVKAVNPPAHAVRWLSRWVARTTPPGSRVLNIGAGSNLSGAMAPMAQRGYHVVGIDPDSSIHDNQTLAERYQMTLEQFAEVSTAPFNAAVAVFVLEHVEDPRAFAAAAARVLRPGGSLYALTVNKYQYFGACTLAATRLGISDWALQRLIGPERMAEYHFPTEYRLNSVRQVRRRFSEAGFSSLDFRLFDKTDMYDWYLPQRLRGFAGAYTRFAYKVGSPQLMGNLGVRAIL